MTFASLDYETSSGRASGMPDREDRLRAKEWRNYEDRYRGLESGGLGDCQNRGGDHGKRQGCGLSMAMLTAAGASPLTVTVTRRSPNCGCRKMISRTPNGS